MAEGTADGHGSATVRRLDPGLFDEAMKDLRERHAASDAQALADGFPTSDSWFRTADVEAAAAALGMTAREIEASAWGVVYSGEVDGYRWRFESDLRHGPRLFLDVNRADRGNPEVVLDARDRHRATRAEADALFALIAATVRRVHPRRACAHSDSGPGDAYCSTCGAELVDRGAAAAPAGHPEEDE